MLHSLLFRDGRPAEADLAPADLPDLHGPATIVWAECEPGDTDGIAEAAALTGIPRDRLDAVMARRHRGGVWHFDAGFALHMHVVRPQDADYTRLVVLLSTDAVVTCTDDPDLDFAPVLSAVESNDAIARHGTFALLHQLLEWLVNGYHQTALDVDDGIDGVEEILFDEAPAAIARVQRESHRLRRRLVLLRRAVLPLREAVDELRGTDPAAGDPWVDRHLADITRRLDHLVGLIESLREMLGSMLSTSINVQQNRLNITMKKLTGWAAVIAIPTFLSSWYGMNVMLPGQHQPWGAALAYGLVAGSAVAVYLSFRRRDWL
ncbi:magnesium transporter CorA family protein [Murinocardiopsis flavida]|nr:CorA family divalent cation transporter [Murinocardiopsis flavida]